jgi:hypothetical protein
MLHSGDPEGARECMEQLQSGDSGDRQTSVSEVQECNESNSGPKDNISSGSVPMGTIVSDLPGNCEKVVVDNISCPHCGGDYYRAAFKGSSLVFVTVEAP